MRYSWSSLLIPVLVMLLAAACGPVPLAGPESATSTSSAALDLLAGTIAGLDPGASASLRLERLALTQPSDQDQVVLRFSVTNGRWQQTGLALSPGRYRLIPEAEGYVSIRGTITFQVPEAGIIWRYTHLNFEFLHPEDAPIRLGVPLCPEPPAHGGTFVLPEGTPTPTPLPLPPAPLLSTPPGPEPWPPGTCYAGHFANGRALPAGLQGQISGLPTGQVAAITLYALPPVPDENYLLGPAPPRDGSWTYPPEVTSLTEQPVIAPDWPLTATLTVSNGSWGLVDPSLAGGKYLVMAQSPGQAAEPPAYEVAIFGGRMLGMASCVDFVFEPVATAALPPTEAPTATPLPTPASAEEAALINLRPLTTSGLAWFGDWAPDGESLVCVTATEPPLLYGRWPGRPEFEMWWMRADGSDSRQLARGYSLFFSTDGQTVFFLHQPLYSNLELWAVDLRGGAPRYLLGPIGGLTVHQLDDGCLVVSESGTYSPLRLFDPKEGTLSKLTGEMPTNSPEDARLSPDGTRLAYPKGQEVYLAEADGSNPRLLSQDGGFSAHVWWSPNSQRLAYTTGNHWTDRLMVADRDGDNQVVLLPSLEESGYVASLAWSPDSRMMLVAAEAYGHQTPRPTRLLLLDADGSGQRQLLEAYLHDASWSPDGRTLALSRWDGPQGDLASHNIWLATLTDRATVAQLPPPTPEPVPTATPPLPLPGADLSPEEVIHRFWEAIDAGDHLTAWASLATQRWARQGLAYFAAEWQCIQEAHVVDIRPMPEVEITRPMAVECQMLQVQVDLKMAGDCFDGLAPGPFTVLVRETPDGPWLIDSFNTGP